VTTPTDTLFREDPYARTCEAQVNAAADGAVRLDRTIFYPAGGGQPGDTGVLRLDDGTELVVRDTRKGEGLDDIVHILDPETALPSPGTAVVAVLDWERRHRHMRMHTCMHLLSAVIDAPVTGGQLTAEKGRLDFDLESQPLDKADVEARLNALITQDLPVAPRWITDDELAAQPGLVKTMRVKPPTGQGQVRLIDVEGIDLQPCGGTHVGRTGEIGPVTVRKIENKGKHNRRVSIAFKDAS
jgi:misacylated tRNA(Ala) deacylase